MTAACTHGVPPEANWNMSAWIDCLRDVGGAAELVGLWAGTLADAHGHVPGGLLREVALAHRKDIGLSGTVIREAVYRLHREGLFWDGKREGFATLRPRSVETPEAVRSATAPAAPSSLMVHRFNPKTGKFEQPVSALNYLEAKAA